MSFKRLDPEDFLVSSDTVTSTVWSDETPRLQTFFTASTTSTNDEYYKNVYKTSARSDIQFALAYGDKLGSGSAQFNDLVAGKTPTRTIYGQFRNLIYGDENADFNFGGTTSETFWAISVERARYKEKLLPASLNLQISGSYDLELTDNSKLVSVDTFLECGRVYQLISGSDGTSYDGGTGYSADQGSYGLFLPDIATVILNPLAISSSIAVEVSRSLDAAGQNISTIFNAISGAASFEVNNRRKNRCFCVGD